MSYRVYKPFALYRYGKKIRKSGPVTLILKFSEFRAVVKVHVRAKFHRAKCMGS